MFNLQGSEIIVILLLALVVLGPEKLPDAIRKFSQTYAELKKMGTGFQSELKSALDEPMREMRETANLIQDAADPQKMMAQAEADSAKPAEAVDPATGDPMMADPETDDRPYGDTDPGSTVADAVADADAPSGPINQIAAANASSALRPTPKPQPEPETDAVSEPVSGAVDALDAVDAVEPDEVQRPSGPAFHSAAPRPANNTHVDQPVELAGASEPDADDADAPREADGASDDQVMLAQSEDATAP